MNRLLPLLLLQLSLKHLPPQAMETHMNDALRKEMAEVETQELMGAQEQANLLSAMMQRSAGALEPSAPSDPEHTSGRGCSDRSSPGRAGSLGDAAGQADGGERSPSGQGQRGPGEVAQALRQGKCQDIRRWLAAGSQLPSTQPAPNDPGQVMEQPRVAEPPGPPGPPRSLGPEMEVRHRPEQGADEFVPEHGPAPATTRGPVRHQQDPGQLCDVRSVPRCAFYGPAALRGSRGLEDHEEGPHAQADGNDYDERGHHQAGQGYADLGRPVQCSILGMEPELPLPADQEGPRPYDPQPGPGRSQGYAAPGHPAIGGVALPRDT